MTDLLARFTRDSQRVLTNAKKMAKKNKQQVISSEHLLFGLLQLTDSQGVQTLQQLRANPEAIKTRLEAYGKLQAKQHQTSPPEVGYRNRRYKLSIEGARIIEAANAEAKAHRLDFVDTRLLLLGMLRHPKSAAGDLLQQHGVELEAFKGQADLEGVGPVDVPRFQQKDRSLRKSIFPVQLSPIFIGLLAFAAISGYLAYAGVGNRQRTVFLFVTGGWLISLALHEFGHALVGFWGGDNSVIDKGYLTLNPLKYTHPLLSIVLPMVFLLLGGIGLPGGAVYINRAAIRRFFVHSLISAAGPLATLIFGLILAIPFLLGLHRESLGVHFPFWAGLAFLVALQVIALLLNLLPIPGLDGFGILEPFLPENILQVAYAIRPYGILLLFFVFFQVEALSREFWQAVFAVLMFINEDLAWLMGEGYQLFRFWENL